MNANPVALRGELTAPWVSAALGMDVTSVGEIETVGTGQMGTCYRLPLTGDPALPPTVLAKLATDDADRRAFLAGSYASEVRFYRDIAPTVSVRVPSCFYAAIADAGVFTLLLEDLAPARPGDQIAGCTVVQAVAAARNLAGLHAPRWSDPVLPTLEGLSVSTQEDADLLQAVFPDALETTLGILGRRVTDEDIALLQQLRPLVGGWSLARADRFSLVHGDYRLDNLLFGMDGGVWTVDWQTVSLGLPARDLAFLVGTGLRVEDRSAHEQEVVEAYHERLTALGVSDHAREECWDDYRFAMLQIPLIVAFGCAYGGRSERGDAMFAVMLERACAAMRDLATLDLVWS